MGEARVRGKRGPALLGAGGGERDRNRSRGLLWQRLQALDIGEKTGENTKALGM